MSGDPVGVVKSGRGLPCMLGAVRCVFSRACPLLAWRSAGVMAAEKPLVVFVLGGPGAGKGTQCANIVKVRQKSGHTPHASPNHCTHRNLGSFTCLPVTS